MKRTAAVCVVVTLMSVFSAALKLDQVCGAPVYHHDDSGNPDEVSCPSDAAKQCKISLSFLKCLTQQGDPAIRLNPGDQVEWYSDQKENKNLIIFEFVSFTQLGSADHSDCDNPKNNDQEPFPNAKNHGFDYIYKDKVHPNSRKKTCYQHVLKLRDPDNGDYDLDPHVIIGDGTQFFSDEAYKWISREKDKKKSATKQSSSRPEGNQSKKQPRE